MVDRLEESWFFRLLTDSELLYDVQKYTKYLTILFLFMFVEVDHVPRSDWNNKSVFLQSQRNKLNLNTNLLHPANITLYIFYMLYITCIISSTYRNLKIKLKNFLLIISQIVNVTINTLFNYQSDSECYNKHFVYFFISYTCIVRFICNVKIK